MAENDNDLTLFVPRHLLFRIDKLIQTNPHYGSREAFIRHATLRFIFKAEAEVAQFKLERRAYDEGELDNDEG
jgi:Arc/MetJ-type ribon-helix-helix transcriptional regulator